VLTTLAEGQAPKLLAEMRERPEAVGEGPAKQNAADCSVAGKKAVSPTLPEGENENPILLKEVRVVQLEPK